MRDTCQYCKREYDVLPYHAHTRLEGYCSVGCKICGLGIDERIGRHVQLKEEYGVENVLSTQQEADDGEVAIKAWPLCDLLRSFALGFLDNPVAMAVSLVKVFFPRDPDTGVLMSDEHIAHRICGKFRAGYSRQRLLQHRQLIARRYPLLKSLVLPRSG